MQNQSNSLITFDTQLKNALSLLIIILLLLLFYLFTFFFSAEVYFPLFFTIKSVYSLIALDVTGGHVGEKNNSKTIWDCCIALSFWHQDGRLIP